VAFDAGGVTVHISREALESSETPGFVVFDFGLFGECRIEFEVGGP
jgi:hypothetical protein